MIDGTRTRLFRTLLVILLGIISYLAVAPIQLPAPGTDKMSHVAAFLALALAADFSFPGRKYDLAKVLPLFGYGMLIEIVQHFLPYRSFEWLDVVSDAAALLIYGVSLPLLRRLPVLRDRWN